MQTFLPYPDLELSAMCLDRQRLGKQRVEAWQIVLSLTEGGGWRNHPATLMWEGYLGGLCLYGMVVCGEWISRGYRDTLLPKFRQTLLTVQEEPLPPWFGDPALHRSHRSNLTRKMPEWYGLLWDDPPDLPYIWPVRR